MFFERNGNNPNSPTSEELEDFKYLLDTLNARDQVSDEINRLMKIITHEGIFGVPQKVLDNSYSLMKKLKQRPTIDDYDLEPVQIALEQEESFITKHKIPTKIKTNKPSRASFYAKRLVALAFGVVVAWEGVGESYVYYNHTPEGYEITAQRRAQANQEAIVRKEEEAKVKAAKDEAEKIKKEAEAKAAADKKAEEQGLAAEKARIKQEEDYNKAIEFEKNRTLGLTPSSPSKEFNIRIKYLPLDKNVDYKEKLGSKANLKNYSDNVWFKLPRLDKDEVEGTNISVHFHNRSDGQLVPKFRVVTDGGDQEWILKAELDEKIDTRVVAFEKISDLSVRFINIRMPQPNQKNLEAILMERVVKGEN